MRDPIDELSNFDPGPTMNPLPPAEVRRRGNRRRRRTAALATIGSIAAIALVAIPIAVATGGDRTDTEPLPATQSPSPSVSAVTAIPADFPLTDGMPIPVKTSTGYQPRITDICDSAGWLPAAGNDTLQALHTDRSEGGMDRTLSVYPTQSQAQLALLALKAELSACAISVDGKDRHVEVISSDVDDSVVYANHYTEGGDTDVVRLVLVGNAILQDSAFTMGGGDPQVVEDTADTLRTGSASTVAAMCVFSATGCTSTSTAADPVTSASADAVTTIPAHFPLLDGLPTTAATRDFGRYGPKATTSPLSVEVCGASVAPTGAVGAMAGGWRDPAEKRERQLLVFASVDDASAYAEGLSAGTSCPVEDLGDGVTRIHSGAGSDLGLGDDAEIAITWHRIDGKPAPGFRVTEFVRVGNAVLVQDRIADGLDDKVTSAYLEQLITDSDQSMSGVVDAMCTFSEGGC